MGTTRCYYEILNVERTATGDEVKRSYRRLAMKYHPDRNPGDAEAEAPRGEGPRTAFGDALEGRDGPLVVDDVENDRRVVGRGEDHGRIEIALGGRAIADPSGGDAGIAGDRGSHRPAHCLDVLGAEIAGNREEPVLLGRIHDGQLPALQRILRVGIDLVHHLRHRVAARDQQPRLTVGREIHVAVFERHAEGAGDRFLAQMLHVERGLALSLGGEHALIECPQRHHVPETVAQGFGIERIGPGADGLALLVDHPDDGESHVADLRGGRIDIGAPRFARARDDEVGEIRLVTRTAAGFGNAQLEGLGVRHG